MLHCMVQFITGINVLDFLFFAEFIQTFHMCYPQSQTFKIVAAQRKMDGFHPVVLLIGQKNKNLTSFDQF